MILQWRENKFALCQELQKHVSLQNWKKAHSCQTCPAAPTDEYNEDEDDYDDDVIFLQQGNMQGLKMDSIMF
jgi:hypothetical protein